MTRVLGCSVLDSVLVEVSEFVTVIAAVVVPILVVVWSTVSGSAGENV